MPSPDLLAALERDGYAWMFYGAYTTEDGLVIEHDPPVIEEEECQ